MLGKSLSTVLVFGSIVASSTVFAGGGFQVIPPASQMGLHSGVYLGASIGVHSYYNKTDSKFFAGPDFKIFPPGTLYLTTSYLSGDTGILGELFGGYQWVGKNFYLAGEAFQSFNNSKFVTNQVVSSAASGAVQTFTQTESIKDNYGFRLRPGYLVAENNLLYIPVGITWGNFEYFLTPETSNIPVFNKRIFGWQYGVGFETAINMNLNLRLEYLYTNYDSFDINFANTTTRKDRKLTPAVDQFTLGLSYAFGKGDCSGKKTDMVTINPSFYLFADAVRNKLLVDASETTVDSLATRLIAAGGFKGDIGFGFGAKIAENYYLAGELFAEDGSAEAVEKQFLKYVEDRTIKNDITYGIGASLLPGVFLADNALLYGRIGTVYSHYKFSDNFVPFDYSSNIFGFQAGAGLQFACSDHLSLRGEYDYTRYQTVNYTIFEGLPFYERVIPSSNQFKLGLVYNF